MYLKTQMRKPSNNYKDLRKYVIICDSNSTGHKLGDQFSIVIV